MSIEINIKYSVEEYKEAIKNKIRAMPNLYFHTFLPSVIFIIISSFFAFFNLQTWWSILILVLSGFYAFISIMMLFYGAHVAALFAKRKKLKPLYNFTLDKKGITRLDEKSRTFKDWREFTSINFIGNYVYFNLQRGGMFLPLNKFDEYQLEELNKYIKTYNKSNAHGKI